MVGNRKDDLRWRSQLPITYIGHNKNFVHIQVFTYIRWWWCYDEQWNANAAKAHLILFGQVCKKNTSGVGKQSSVSVMDLTWLNFYRRLNSRGKSKVQCAAPTLFLMGFEMVWRDIVCRCTNCKMWLIDWFIGSAWPLFEFCFPDVALVTLAAHWLLNFCWAKLVNSLFDCLLW